MSECLAEDLINNKYKVGNKRLLKENITEVANQRKK